jgi:3'-5' exoribonuclease
MTPSSAPAPPRQRQSVSSLASGDAVDEVYLLSTCDQRTKKNGDPFFSMTLRDATGSVNAVMWDRHEELVEGRIVADHFVHVEGATAEFNGAPQVTVRRIRKVEEASVTVADFLPVSPIPRGELEAQLDALLASVRQPDCKRLLGKLFGNARFRELYCTAPAAARIHQAYIHGLLEHTLNVVRNALALGEVYGPVDRDLLITAGLLHDVGKIREYDWRRTITYTDEGRLLGHISIGAGMIDGVIREMQRSPEGFPEHYRLHILHLILSHHGKLEYGSPTIPKTREAFLLHYADYNDAYMASFNELMVEAQQKNQRWTPYNRMFGSYLLVPPPDPSNIPGTASEPLGTVEDLDPREAVHSAEGNPDDRA